MQAVSNDAMLSFVILIYFSSLSAPEVSADYVTTGMCSSPTTNVRVPRNATRLLFIGAHHTGTNSYVDIFKRNGIPRDLRVGLSYPGHKKGWYSDPFQMWKHDILADTPYYSIAEWNATLEYGHFQHPDVRYLSRCFPKALFVLNTRSLASYARSKVAWETARTRRGLPSAPCATGDAPDVTNRTSSAEGNLTVHPNRSALSYGLLALKVCDAAVVRERVHRAFLTFIDEDRPARQPRFLVTNLPAEGYARVVYRLCRFLGTTLTHLPLMIERREEDAIQSKYKSALRATQCAPMLDFTNYRAHGSIYVRADCEDELVRGILADPPQEVRHVKLDQFLPTQKPVTARRHSFRYRRRLAAHKESGEGSGEEVLSACTLLRNSGVVNANASVLAFSQHPAASAFFWLIQELETRFAPNA